MPQSKKVHKTPSYKIIGIFLAVLSLCLFETKTALAAITVLDENTGTDTTSAFTVTRPSAGTGDFIVVVVGEEDDNTFVPPSGQGWVEGDQLASNAGSTDLSFGFFYKLITNIGTEPTTYNFTGPGANDNTSWWVASLGGVDSANPADETMSDNLVEYIDVATTSFSAPSITTVTPGAFVIAGWGVQTDATVSMPGGSWATETNNLASGNIYMSVASQTFASSGPTGNVSITAETSATEVVAGQFAFKPATPPQAPTNVSATDGTLTDKVTVTWTKSSGASGYYVYEGANLIATLGDVATFDDSSAPSGSITAGTASATDGTSGAHVTLSLSGEGTTNGTSRTYKVQAFNSAGTSGDSNTDTGYRGVGTISYQWQRSAADSDASYSDISGGTTDPYNDTGAPADGSGRYFKCVLTATGATSQTSTADRGYINTPPTTVLNTPNDGGSTTDTTPTFNFTATDADSNPVEYNFQLDTATTFDSQGGSPLLNKVSTTDSGFTAGHPFSSGSAAEFTVQAGDTLSPGTYYWRARAIDPTGSNTYGNFATFRTLTIAVAGIDLSGTIYQSSNESLAYDCSGGNSKTILVRVNGAGSFSGTCDQNTGAWSTTGIPISSGQTVYAYLSGVSVAGSTVMVSNGSAKANVPIIVDRVVLRDDVDSWISNAEILAGNTADAEDLITTPGSNHVVVGPSYETHIYTGDTYSPGGYVTTGKLHVVGSYTGAQELLTLTGSGTGTSRPLYVDGGTFTVPDEVQFQGTSGTDIEALTYASLTLNPTLTAGTTYTFLGAASANGNFTINPTATSSYSLSVNLAGAFTVASTGTTTIQGTTSGIGVLNTTASNYQLNSGKIDIASGGILTANDSNIYLTGTTSTLFTKTGTFNQGTSAVYFQPGSGSPTLTSGAITFYDAIVNMLGQTGAVGGSTTISNNLTVTAGTLSIPSTYSLSVNGNTVLYDSLTISSTGDQTFSGTTTVAENGIFTRSSASGTNIFSGLLSIEIDGWFNTSNNPSFTLRSGLSNNGSFTSGTGTYTFDTNDQSISGSATTTFSGDVAVGAGNVQLTNQNTGVVTVTGNLSGGDVNAGYINSTNSTTHFKGGVFGTGGVLTATANPNYIYYTSSSAQIVKTTTYHDLYVQPSGNSVTSYIDLGTLTVNGNLTVGNGTNTGVVVEATTWDPNISVLGNVTVSNNTTFTNSDSASKTLNIDGDLTITGTFTAPVGTSDTSFTLGGDFIKTGAFNHNNGQITFDTTGVSQLDYSSDTTFYQFSASAGKNLQFDETYTTIIANDITIQGTNCGPGKIYLDSVVNDNHWAINIQTGATQSITYIDLEDADGSGSQQTPTATDATQTGTNTGWSITEGICVPAMNFEGINMSGININ